MTSPMRRLSVVLGLLFVLQTAAATATPNASITSPAFGLTRSNVFGAQNFSPDIPVTGTANVTGTPAFRNYTLESAPNGTSSWTTIITSTTPVTNGTLGTWKTLDKSDGTYWVNGDYQLRLTVCDTASTCVTATVTTIHIKNFYIEHTTREFNGKAGQTMHYVVHCPLPNMNFTASLTNSAAAIVRSFGATAFSGDFPYDWDGKNTGGVLQPDGPYFVTSQVTYLGSTSTWDQTGVYLPDCYLGVCIQVANYGSSQTWDPWTGDSLDLHYNFQTGRVTISMSTASSSEIPAGCPPSSGGFCLLDRKYEESGDHTLRWVGTDLSGKYHTDVQYIAVVSEQDQFSKVAVVLYGSKPVISNLSIAPRMVKVGTPQTLSFAVSPATSMTAQAQFASHESGTTLRTASWSCTTGSCSFVWDGKADNGMLVAPGGYTVTASVTDASGNVVSEQALAYIQY
jgi:flagellar hook assembly protein FlgD